MPRRTAAALATSARCSALIRTGEAVTRADLGRVTGLSRPAVQLRVGELLERGLVVERTDAPSTGGRPPRPAGVQRVGRRGAGGGARRLTDPRVRLRPRRGRAGRARVRDGRGAGARHRAAGAHGHLGRTARRPAALDDPGRRDGRARHGGVRAGPYGECPRHGLLDRRRHPADHPRALPPYPCSSTTT
ncbi:MarR family transcriptional regulator [Nonomuraea rubra]|uniref:MarR family transcriptional regulator n=1 Tax=Nonomuraea rubra TaxID=46180 RepID=UPI003CD05C9D